jgi:hypothetical protein
MSSSDYLAGSYANGSYNFSSYTHNEQASDLATLSASGTETDASNGTLVNNTQGISTSGINGTYLYAASGSSSWSGSETASDTYTLHAEGCFTNGSWALNSMVLNAAATLVASSAGSGSDSATNTKGCSSGESCANGTPPYLGRIGVGGGCDCKMIDRMLALPALISSSDGPRSAVATGGAFNASIFRWSSTSCLSYG